MSSSSTDTHSTGVECATCSVSGASSHVESESTACQIRECSQYNGAGDATDATDAIDATDATEVTYATAKRTLTRQV